MTALTEIAVSFRELIVQLYDVLSLYGLIKIRFGQWLEFTIHAQIQPMKFWLTLNQLLV